MRSRLTKEALLQGLATRRFGRQLYVFDELDSTNACARTLASTGSPEGTAVVADFQTAGRGRLGRSWTSEPGQNLLLSLILKPGSNHSIPTLPYVIGVGVVEGLKAATGLKPSLKWPNDIQIDGKKMCGILLEQEGSGNDSAIIAGIGTNVNQTSFDPEMAERATSLALGVGAPVDRNRIFHALLLALERAYDRAAGEGVREVLRVWSENCVTIGKRVTVEQGGRHVQGIAIGLSADGGLKLEHKGRMTIVYAGDSTILPFVASAI